MFQKFHNFFILKISTVTVKTLKKLEFPSFFTTSQPLSYKVRRIEIRNFTLILSIKNTIERPRGETFRYGIP